MNEKNTKTLFKKFPILYAGKDKPITENLMGFGFSCGDGWYWLIYELSERLEAINVGLKKAGVDPVRALQVKEKFGGLRFYTSYAGRDVQEMIDEAEARSYTICEVCSKEGRPMAIKGWVTTICDECKNAV